MFNKFKLEKENKELKGKLKIAYRLVAELNLRLGNNQSIEDDYLDLKYLNYDKDIVVNHSHNSANIIITTIKSEDYMNKKSNYEQ